MAKNVNLNMTQGPLLGKIIRFSVPLMLSGMLQLLYNAADVVVVGQFAGSAALAAVGSTGALVNLLINLFMGVSVGCNVLVARYYGSRDYDAVSQTVHCAMGSSVIIGVMASIVGLLFSTPLLRLMGSPEDVLPLASLYLRIYFCGMPFNIAYNFGAAVLRAVGDTKRPLYILSVAGLVNVGLNLVLVIFFHMGVAGVAIATVVSQIISALLVVRVLTLREDCCHLNVKAIHIYKDKLIGMIKVGLPAGIQGSLFSLSNVIIQSSVNSFGSIVVAGNSAAANIEGFAYTAMNAVYQACITFVSQNLGAQKPKRILKVMGICILVVSIVGLTLGNLMFLFGEQLLAIYCSDSEGLQAEMIAVGLTRMKYLAVPYFLCGLMEIGCGGMRGLGWSWLPTSVSLMGACGVRVMWIFTIFRQIGTLNSLYISYPISWGITFAAHMLCFFFVFRKVKRTLPEETEEALPA